MLQQKVAPVRERGLKLAFKICSQLSLAVAPVRERGLKSVQIVLRPHLLQRRSRKGAWIEI